MKFRIVDEYTKQVINIVDIHSEEDYLRRMEMAEMLGFYLEEVA